MKPRFQFGNIVVVDDNQIGVIVKILLRVSIPNGYVYEVYVCGSEKINKYDEDSINHYVYSEELSEGEKEFY